MKYSIVVPVYDVEHYLNQCLDSVLLQDCGDFELIVVDDGSTDRSPEICDAYARADGRVRVIHQENRGVSAARNAGIRAAGGDFLLLLDSDDFWTEPSMLTELTALLDKTDADVILFRVRAWFEPDDTYRIKTDPFDYSVLDRFNHNAALHYIFSQKQFPVGVYAVCVRRNLLTEHRIEFVEGVKSEDYDWLLSVLRDSGRIYATDRVYCTYRMGRETQATHNVDLPHLSNLLQTVSKWADAPGIRDETIRKDVRNYAAYLYSTALVVAGGIKKRQRRQAAALLKQSRSALRGAEWPELRLIRLAVSVLGIRLTSFTLHWMYALKFKLALRRP